MASEVACEVRTRCEEAPERVWGWKKRRDSHLFPRGAGLLGLGGRDLGFVLEVDLSSFFVPLSCAVPAGSVQESLGASRARGLSWPLETPQGSKPCVVSFGPKD